MGKNKGKKTAPEKPKPYVLMAPEAWDLMWDYVDMVPGEVAVWGYVEADEYELYVSEIFLVPQTANSGGVDFVTDGLPYAINKAIQDDKLDQLRFCAHSHGHHSAFWSSTDEEMISTLGESGTPWLVSAIFNKKGETKSRLDVFADTQWGKMAHTFDNLSIQKERPHLYEEQLITDLETFVKEPPKPTPKSTQTTGAVTPATQRSLENDNEVKPFIDNISFDTLEIMAENRMWNHIDDSDGIRWYYDGDGEVTAACLIPSDYNPQTARSVDGSVEEDEATLGVTANS